jgi:signal transduction histidine kinase
VSVGAARINGTAGLTVTDGGPGLPDHSDTKVFERFYTGDATQGAGLGLAIAQELAERMQGRIRLSSSGAGATTFTLELPSPDGDAA